MITGRRVAAATVLWLVAIALLPNTLLLGLATLAALLLASAAYAMWLRGRGEWDAREQPASAPEEHLAEIASARLGEPVCAVCRFVLRVQHSPHQRWHGHEPLWIAATDGWLWLLYRTPNGGIGGVKSKFGRRGLHGRWTAYRLKAHHLGELSWPEDTWFIAGELHGKRPQRLRLIGLLAGDELGVRHLVNRDQT